MVLFMMMMVVAVMVVVTLVVMACINSKSDITNGYPKSVCDHFFCVFPFILRPLPCPL
jgi:hypothetical protein